MCLLLGTGSRWGRDSITCEDGKKWYDHFSANWARQGHTRDDFVDEMWAKYRLTFQPSAAQTWKRKDKP